ncbi:sensor histidine kinase [Actinocorallia longicatena]|uniref:histidine kinase n=1 Tax=Actinocorallia longicatena TaxID=111803 RepID=A0ABP6QK15_9ACTN
MFNNVAVRLLAVMVVVATASIAATAWLASATTSNAMRRLQNQTIEGDAKIYAALLEFAATHKDWKDVGETLEGLTEESGRRITLVTKNGEKVGDTGSGSGRPASPSAEIDPLNVNTGLAPNASKEGIDNRIMGPFRVTDAEYKDMLRNAYLATECTKVNRADGSPFKIVSDPFDGRPMITGDQESMEQLRAAACYPPSLTQRTGSQKPAFAKWKSLALRCMRKEGLKNPHVDAEYRMPGSDLTFVNLGRDLDVRGNSDPETAHACVVSSRREMLTPYTAEPALLYLGGEPPGLADIGRRKTFMVATLVFFVTVGAAWLAARRLTQPIRTLTAATARMGAGDHTVRVPVSSGDELGRLGASFNTMAEELERNERQRQDVVSDVAHELRTPLANISGWLEAAEDGVADLDKDLIAYLMGESQTLQRLVNDLQDLALAEAGRLTLHPEELSLAALLDQVATAHRPRAEDVAILVEAEPVTLTADPVRLRQAVGNLVGNALRHTAPGGTVTLTGTPYGISVADTGSGISSENLPHVFDRFWRADRSRTRSTGGSGLGLAITKQLVEAHGYTITVTSRLGEGSTFTIHL